MISDSTVRTAQFVAAVFVIVLGGGGVLPILWKLGKVLNRVQDVLRDYPPHRHEDDGTILFPFDFQPTTSKKLRTQKL